jgi:hypothetical protein
VDAHAHIVERVVQSGADALSSGHPAGAGTPSGLRRHVSDACGHVREHAVAWYCRSVDPTPLAGARPGAVAAAVAGCLAVGGGATYCAQQGADPFSALARLGDRPAHQREQPKQPRKRARTAQATAPPVATPTVAVAPQAVPPPPPPPPPVTTTVAPPPPAPEDEFEPTSAGTSQPMQQTPTEQAATKPREPAPAPADGPAEFGGP